MSDTRPPQSRREERAGPQIEPVAEPRIRSRRGDPSRNIDR
jgi:hypothetical protein